MIKAPEFYQIFKEYDAPLIEAGFKRKAKNKYLHPEEVLITVVLDRWGWVDELGWGFLLRVCDIKDVDIVEHPLGRKTIDIKGSYLFNCELVDSNELLAIYKDYKESHPKFYEYITSGWISFYDAKNLRDILETYMPTFGKIAADKVSEFRKLYP